MNKQIILSILSIMLVIGGVSGATYAFFSDQGQVLGNTFSTGTLNLTLSGNGTTYADNVTATFGASGALAPNTCTGPHTLHIKNEGTITSNHIKVTDANTITDVNNDADPDMDNYLQITQMLYDGSIDATSSIPDSNTNGYKDLHDLQASPTGTGALALADSGDHTLAMNVCLHSTAPNVLQGDSVSSVFTVTLNQDSSQ